MVDAIERAELVKTAPEPWTIRKLAVGGLTYVGFAPGTDLLLIISSAGRSVIDCTTGERLARDYEAYGNWLDEAALEAIGIGPLEGQRIRITGIGGGGLSLGTPDGFCLYVFPLHWPINLVVLTSNWRSPYELNDGREVPFLKIAEEHELRAFGFSQTGRSLIVATSSDLLVWSRGG
jgi:hypothetical protein